MRSYIGNKIIKEDKVQINLQEDLNYIDTMIIAKQPNRSIL